MYPFARKPNNHPAKLSFTPSSLFCTLSNSSKLAVKSLTASASSANTAPRCERG